MKVFTLGTGGFIPTERRQTSCFLVRRGEGAILLDAGTGVQRLADPELQCEISGVARLDVILSHLHLDHIAGLTWLLRMWPREIVVHVPTTPLVAADGVRALLAYTSPPFFSLPLAEWPQRVHVAPMTARSLVLPSGVVSVMPQEHSGGSVAIRLGGLTFVTDAVPGETHVPFLGGTDLLLIDTMHDTEDYESMIAQGNRPDHGSSQGNADLADVAGVQRMALIHVDPSYGEAREARLAAQARQIFPGSFLPADGDVYTVADN